MKNTNITRLVLFFLLNSFIGNFTLKAQDSLVVLDKIIAKVDNQILLKSEYDIAYLQAIQSNKDFQIDISKCQILEQLLTNKLLLAKADIDSVVVDDKMVEAELDRRMEYFIQQIGSREKLEAYYNKKIDQLKSELRKQVKEQKIIQRMQENISNKIKVSPSEVRKFYNSIPKDSLPFFSKEFEIGHIVKMPNVSKNQKIAAREKLNNIRKLIIEESQSFESLAKQFSEDPGSGSKGGELGYFKKGELVPEYEAAAFRLKPGEISPVIESIHGFHIIQLIDRRGNEYNSRHILLRPVSSENDLESSSLFLDSIRTLIIRDSLAFEKAAKEHSDDKMTKETGGMIMDQEANTSKIPAEKIDPVLYFLLDTMKVGHISKPMPFRTFDGKDAFRIVYFKSVSEPHLANLKDDYQRIQFATLQEKKNKLLNEWFKKTRGEVFIDVDKEYKDCDILSGL
ncbi:MAG: peptidylprolyl isomerase [Bacteroidota bacterium]|nr:peptidylprolyl isomerase [Bacteroidota bacterium]